MRREWMRNVALYGIPVATFFIAIFLVMTPAQADVLDDLKKSIEQKNAEIQKLEEDAKKYRTELASKQQMGKNLKQELARIQTNIKKLQNDNALTQKQIKRAELQIVQISYEITSKEQSINKLKNGLAGLLTVFYETEQNSSVLMFLREPSFSAFFQMIDGNAAIQKKVLSMLDELHALRTELQGQKTAQEQKRDESKDLSNLLQQQQQTLVSQKNEQNQILTVTQQQEKLYQELLADQEKKRQQLDSEIQDIEAKIRVTIDASSLPSKGTGVIGWPVPDLSKQSCFGSIAAAKNCITQFFGYTQFAAAGNYNGKGHNGVDFRADIGTPIFSVSGGVVTGTGDTDAGCRGVSYGKWILIEHTNNLSTIYAHLSQINVSPGTPVSRGTRIALSGKSGYATGPHLHFGLFATQGVSIQSIRSKVCGTLMTLPIVAINAYLNPLDYL